MDCGVGSRRGSDPALPWLCRRLEATAPIRSLAWELSHAIGAALEILKKKKSETKVLIRDQKKKVSSIGEL